jgi:hypothetical protein
LHYLISIVVECFRFVGAVCQPIQFLVVVKIDFYMNGVTRTTLAQVQSKVRTTYQVHWDYILNCYSTAHTTLYDKEKAILKQNNKRKAEALESTASTASPTDSTTSSQSTTFSLKKKQKKAAAIKASDEVVPGSWTMPLSQESEKSTSRLKKEQYCLLLADEILKGKVRRAVEHLRTELLTDEEKQDPTATRYLYFGVENSQPKQNVHELFFGNKNDVRRLVELEGKKLSYISLLLLIPFFYSKGYGE